MTQAHLNLQSQLDSQNISNISDPSTTPLCNNSPMSFHSPIEPTNNQIEQMDTTHKFSDTDNNETQNHKPPEQSPSTPPPSKKKYDTMKDPIFLTSPVYPPLISPKDSISTQRDDYLIPILANENFTLKSQLPSLYMHPTEYTFELYDKNQYFFTSIASKMMTPYRYWLDKNVKFFSLQFNFLRPSIYDLKTDEDEPSFLSFSQKATHHNTFVIFLKHQKPKNYIFINYIYTSPYTMTHLYTNDHSRITGYQRNYDPIKQFFCLLPYNDTSRPIIVPQVSLIHFDDFLLPCNVPTIIANPLTVIKHLVTNTLNNKEKSYYTALSNQASSYNELNSAKIIAFMVKAERPNLKHNTPLLNITLRNHQQPLLTNSTMFLHHELSVISLTNSNQTKRILRILHLQQSHTFLIAMITL